MTALTTTEPPPCFKLVVLLNSLSRIGLYFIYPVTDEVEEWSNLVYGFLSTCKLQYNNSRTLFESPVFLEDHIKLTNFPTSLSSIF